jgi:hypothetical protein
MHVFRYVAIAIAKTLSKVFGLATMTFFGRLPSREDDKMSLVGVASLLWLPIFVAVFLPAFAETIIPFAPDDEELTRRIAIGLAVLIPIVVGVTVAMMRNNRGRGVGHTITQVLLGFPYTVIIGVTVTIVIVVVPLIKITYLIRRFEVMRVLVMIEPAAYQGALDHLRDRLEAHGVQVCVEDPNRLIGGPFRVLVWVLGRIFHREVTGEMRVLRPADPDTHRDEWFEITLHATDVTIIGPQQVASRLHAILVDAMDERVLYLTWDDGSQELEDRIRRARQRLDAGEPVERSETEELVDDLADLALGKEEWDAVRRLIYRLERDAEVQRADRALEAS